MARSLKRMTAGNEVWDVKNQDTPMDKRVSEEGTNFHRSRWMSKSRRSDERQIESSTQPRTAARAECDFWMKIIEDRWSRSQLNLLPISYLQHRGRDVSSAYADVACSMQHEMQMNVRLE